MGQNVLLGLGGLSVLILFLMLGAALYVMVKYLGIDRAGNLAVDAAGRGEPRNYLVVGSDARNEAGSDVGGQRSDTLMVMRVDPQRDDVTVLSIPRDLVVPISGTGEEARINSAYGVSRATLMDTVRDNFDIDLHHYVEIDFEAFESLVDSAGGVPLWIDSPIKDDASGLYVSGPGCVTLDGEQALAFVRSRELQYMTSSGSWSMPDPTADLGRVDRQQVFVRRALAEAMSRARSDPRYLPELVDMGLGAMTIDESMSIRDLLDLADGFRDFDPDALTTIPLPVEERGDGATLSLDPDTAGPVLDMFRTEAATQSADDDGADDSDEGDGGAPTNGEAGAEDVVGAESDDSAPSGISESPEFVVGDDVPSGQHC